MLRGFIGSSRKSARPSIVVVPNMPNMGARSPFFEHHIHLGNTISNM